jgi:23S rRNA G2445 N2-methylase RlmL
MSRIATRIFFVLAQLSRSSKDDAHAAAYALRLTDILEAEGLQVDRRPGRLGVRA